MKQDISDTGREKKTRFQGRRIWSGGIRVLKRLQGLIRGNDGAETKIQKESEAEEPWENPYLNDFRNILMQILKQRNMEFGDFHPILIDSDEREQSFLEDEDTVRLLAQIGDGLNALEILTDRPEYFKTFSERMNEEYGLLTQIYPRDYRGSLLGNVVLDLERHSELEVKRWADKILYIPFYKRRWTEKKDEQSMRMQIADEMLETGMSMDDREQGNLDIEVPIGYNIVTVKTKASDIRDRL